MKTAGKPGSSLWWTLSWQLNIVVAAMIVIFSIGLCVYSVMTGAISPIYGIWDELPDLIDESLVADNRNRLLMKDGPALRTLQDKNEAFWIVVSTLDGASATYGAVPAAYAGLSPYIHLMIDADLRGGEGVSEVAVVESFDSRFGPVRVMVGGVLDARAPLWKIIGIFFISSGPLLLFMLVLVCLSVFFSVPRIVRHALDGLNSVVKKAPEIDPRQPGSSLPVEDVPREVAPLIHAFNDILTRLHQQFQSRQRFLIDAAHELRTPIAIMQTRIEGLQEGPEQKRLMEDVARLGQTTEQLLAFERNDQVSDRWERVDLVTIARTVVADFAPLALSAGYDISFEKHIERFDISGDRHALLSAVGNLVRNAIDHGGNRGMILVSILPDGEIAVSDQGDGIPQEHQDRIFEPFYRVTPRSTGAGLGLSLVKQIVTNHNGRITLESHCSGSTFRMRFHPLPAKTLS